MNNNDQNLEKKVYDVLIVGAGPVGLATAIGLRKRGVDNLLVIDKTSEFRPVGKTIDLLPNGLKALNYIEPVAYEKVKDTGLKNLNFFNQKHSQNDGKRKEESNQQQQQKYWCLKNLEGETIRSISLDFETWFNQYQEGRVSIPWYDLQTILRNTLPTELIKINHRCVNLQQDSDLMTVNCVANTTNESNQFAHWEMEQLSTINDNKREFSNLESSVNKLSKTSV
ncbi:MAG TPA: hypothetical protein DCF68_11655 [Cyanothece sp. UBA12306]|nr:hypothetical protein [Cyanothece sp. UBA12306]